MTQFNFACDTDYPKKTLLQMRRRMLVRLGYAAQASNPPPGMAELLNDYLEEAQRLLYSGAHGALFRTKRWFTWPLVADERFYGFPDNVEDPTCSKTLNPEMIDKVWVSQGDDNWWPVVRGIEPWMYNQMSASRPMRWQISQGIELWPPPSDESVSLRIYGNFDLLPFTDDAHVTTIDPDLIFLRAMAVAKRHARHPDATDYAELGNIRLGELVAATHEGKRYIHVPRDMRCYCENNPGIFGSAGIRYIEDGSVRIVGEV